MQPIRFKRVLPESTNGSIRILAVMPRDNGLCAVYQHKRIFSVGNYLEMLDRVREAGSINPEHWDLLPGKRYLSNYGG